ncbi:hypothetical protein DSM104635_00875 [Terricaulis silvestris]|uniref:Uncharacterized protein n=1 Tax=Terricaulis silvestris TaxID=2686094 RepID=A0A6I6MHX1_9CAUL|nr:hypothetical protein DSM104635_00875 [Terricaulis silvestris]
MRPYPCLAQPNPLKNRIRDKTNPTDLQRA